MPTSLPPTSLRRGAAPVLRRTLALQDIILLGSELVGRYALSFMWSDGHKTGIFAWPRLNALGELRSGA